MKIVVSFLILLATTFTANAQQLKSLIKKAKETVAGNSGQLGAQEIASGLKEALAIGAEKGAATLSKENGFFGNPLMKIILPAEAQKVEKVLRGAGLGKMVDDAIITMNRGAEEACKEAAPIFINAIKEMDLNDAIGILRGADTAATGFLRNKTTQPLTEAFRPVINASLEKTGATKYWASMISAYNRVSFQKINPDLSGYVTEKALQGIFTQIAMEEKNIRKDPMARTTDLLKKVFSGQ